MLEIKNANEIEALVGSTNNSIGELRSQLDTTETELKLLESAKKTSKWFDESITLIHQLEAGENIEILKEIISHFLYVENKVEGMIAFDESWLANVSEPILSFRIKNVPDTFHKWSIHQDWFKRVYELKDKYPSAYIETSKSNYIWLITQSIESIGAWCMHRLYILDEQPRFFR